jgi:hypothetical protein
LENYSRQPRGLLKTDIVTASKKTTYSFSGDGEEEDVVDDVDDDEVRTSAS